MKNLSKILIASLLCLSMTACSTDSTVGAEETSETTTEETKKESVAGVIWYNFGDTFIANARKSVNKAAEDDGQVSITDADSLGDVAVQTSNINNMYTQGVDYLVVNNINTNAITEMVQDAKDHETPIIFANTNSPSEEDFENFDDAWHVSSVADQSGTIIGELVAEYWEEHPEADRNGNGKLDYVMLLGLQDHYDTQARAKYSIEAIEAAGIETSLLQEEICNYQRNQAQDKMNTILQANKDNVEAVIACNDDMALGAIEALKAVGFYEEDSEYIPVVGVDASVVGCESIKEGLMLGSALNNPVTLGNSIYNLIKLIDSNEEVTNESIGVDGVTVDGHHIYIDYIGITKDNLEEAEY